MFECEPNYQIYTLNFHLQNSFSKYNSRLISIYDYILLVCNCQYRTSINLVIEWMFLNQNKSCNESLEKNTFRTFVKGPKTGFRQRREVPRYTHLRWSRFCLLNLAFKYNGPVCGNTGLIKLQNYDILLHS